MIKKDHKKNFIFAFCSHIENKVDNFYKYILLFHFVSFQLKFEQAFLSWQSLPKNVNVNRLDCQFDLLTCGQSFLSLLPV